MILIYCMSCKAVGLHSVIAEDNMNKSILFSSHEELSCHMNSVVIKEGSLGCGLASYVICAFPSRIMWPD